MPGWRRPALWGVGISAASSEPEWEFPCVNQGGAYLPAVVLGRLVRHSQTTETLPVTVDVLRRAIDDHRRVQLLPDVRARAQALAAPPSARCRP